MSGGHQHLRFPRPSPLGAHQVASSFIENQADQLRCAQTVKFVQLVRRQPYPIALWRTVEDAERFAQLPDYRV